MQSEVSRGASQSVRKRAPEEAVGLVCQSEKEHLEEVPREEDPESTEKK